MFTEETGLCLKAIPKCLETLHSILCMKVRVPVDDLFNVINSLERDSSHRMYEKSVENLRDYMYRVYFTLFSKNPDANLLYRYYSIDLPKYKENFEDIQIREMLIFLYILCNIAYFTLEPTDENLKRCQFLPKGFYIIDTDYISIQSMNIYLLKLINNRLKACLKKQSELERAEMK